MQSAMLYGLAQTQESITQQIAVHCPGNHCKWAPYDSLAVCNSCTDLTGVLKNVTKGYIDEAPYTPQENDFGRYSYPITGAVTKYSLSNGVWMDYSMNLISFGTTKRSRTVTFLDDHSMIWSLTIINRTTDGSNLFSAMECGLRYCVNTYSSEYVNGTLQEAASTIPPTLQSNISLEFWDNIIGFCESGFEDYNASSSSISSHSLCPRDDLQFMNKYNLSFWAVDGMAQSLEDLFSTNATSYATGSVQSDGNGFFYSPASMQSIYNSPDLNQTFAGLAMSMTNAMRVGDDNGTVAYGTVGITVYKITGAWIALPLTCILGGGIFLILTIIYTRRQQVPIWKSSSLAILKFGLQNGYVLDSEPLISGMEEKAKRTQVASHLMRGRKY
ncbi:acid phosphatase protein [Rutstroemia sp. NJR-2017a WRK4]|nr:acid phosphatase protein [Rutstroemia sp. NJR-2017a WRK4]PQE32295.1 acid phosphatase protein [Rutstroemia sp. NJR-2017a WRK4]